ncbi:MAG TPA: flippase activity-associated protein Agl23 [Anaerolineales bacterium]|nr:flippase activity-associated protein Agl23 [Anaerolineales bacterium]
MQATSEHSLESRSWLDRPLLSTITINWELVLFASIVLIAIVTRFFDLGARVMSHDESLHTYYSWRLYRGFGFEHSPLMHGPFQFIFIALSYFILGDSDFSARIPVVLTSIATVAFMWQFRRYLGRVGAIIAALLFTISPYMLYYGRYVRNEAYVGLFGLMALWAILRYLDSGEHKYLYYLTAATVLHFTAKETAFIYVAQSLIFLAFLFIQHVNRAVWPNPDQKRAFLITLTIGFAFLLLAGGTFLLARNPTLLNPAETAAPVAPDQEVETMAESPASRLPVIMGGMSLLAFGVSGFFLIQGYSLENIRRERTFDLLIMLGTMVLPQLAAFPVKAFGGNPTDYSTSGILRTATVLVPLAAITIGIGLWWNRRVWLTSAALFYGVFVVLYTTIFTNGQGFFTGIVGSLGYWLEQQGVRRGSQPWYYYLVVQVPVYEYLPALGSLLALGMGLRRWMKGNGAPSRRSEGHDPQVSSRPEGEAVALPFFGFWVLTSAVAYTAAGEKMPWLTFHVALPMVLVTAWALGQLIEKADWKSFAARRGWVVVALLIVFFPAWVSALASLLGSNPPFQGSELAQLQATSTFLTAIVTAILSGWGLYTQLKNWQAGQTARVILLVFFGLLVVLTTRTAFVATYINYDNANEYLVYAHSNTPVKTVMNQVEDISRRMYGDLSMPVAYDDDVSWPFSWYLRNYTNQRYYQANPTRDLRDVPVIIVGDNNFTKVEPIVGQAYYQLDYIRMVWPDQGYFNLTWDRVKNALSDPQWRTALFNIWFNRDYTLYSELSTLDLSLANWRPADLMRMYVRKDVAAKLWNYGLAAAPEELVADPYEGKGIQLIPDFSFGTPGNAPGQFNQPRNLAVAPDGTIYVADTYNNRIQHLNPDGSVISTWGTFANILQGDAPAGTLNEPWDVAVSPDGAFVYVADTWNHRVQKFTADGEFVTMWGYFGQAENPDGFWGPRSVAVDANGNVFVTDTGNKRIAIFDENGNFLRQFGEEGFEPGMFYEPVGIALNPVNGYLYIADTWNQRMQIMFPDPANPLNYIPLKSWDITGWYGQSLENKPYLAVDGEGGRLLVADPEGYRVLEFTAEGDFVRYWGDYSTATDGFGLVSGVAFDADGGVWVSDGANNWLLHFTLP